MLHENNVSTVAENDEDTSSNHSSISSTSFGSGDVVHDRSSYSSYHRMTSSSSTNNSNRDTYTSGRDFYGVSLTLNLLKSKIKIAMDICRAANI